MKRPATKRSKTAVKKSYKLISNKKKEPSKLRESTVSYLKKETKLLDL